ncbi:glycosyltransferase family 2 protein [Roseivirga pacifica]|uniref:glycosyltransferase family 2 protein n=1 Tax=Roseivirga pacifica TaxID=1267423 RepID=UPI00227C900B|nr:glycosyltransferase family 2 protein [Roseivirga pacifica]
MRNSELVSIVTANYNSEKYIKQLYDSLLSQKYVNWEWLVIDDCSNDASPLMITAFMASDSRVKLFRNDKNKGPAHSRNKGIRKAKGRYVTFIDSDDFWEDDFLSESISIMEKNKYFLVFSSYKRFIEEEDRYMSPFIVPDKVDYKELLKTCSISCLTAVYDAGHFGLRQMPEIAKRQDYGFWLNLLKDVDYAYGIKRTLATYRIRKSSVSRNKVKAMYYVWVLFRKVEKINFFKSLYYFIVYSVNGYLKYR